jgi:hypothetical protein
LYREFVPLDGHGSGTGDEDAANAERRAAAIAELTKRAGLAVPVQNEATFYRAEALERLSVLVDAGEKPKGGRGKTAPKLGGVSAPNHRRVAEGRSLRKAGARAEAEAEAGFYRNLLPKHGDTCARVALSPGKATRPIQWRYA